ncbi:MAG: penicillin-binding protein 2 [Patescibacteria group bacterium]|nr:penicillin-binding protein 2 [Patescibacteria group bacterium]
MRVNYQPQPRRKEKPESSDLRFKVAVFVCLVAFLVIAMRLFTLMILQHGFYTALASGSQDMYESLFPKRGEIFLKSENEQETFPLAINRDLYTVYSDNRQIKDNETAEDILEKLAKIFNYDDERKAKVLSQLQKIDDPYEPLEKKVEEETIEKLKELNLPGIAFSSFPQRYYPEASLAAQIVGFLGKDQDGKDVGRYGLEGYWQDSLAGNGGFLEGSKTAQGSWIPLAGRSLKLAEDGVDLFLTIDRTLQFEACRILEEERQRYEAETAALIIIDPKTGAIKTMCSSPTFDLNKYNEVESAEAYNNQTIFTPYEPGSVFKPIIMSAALNEGVVTPDTTFVDSGQVDANCQKSIYNADLKAYGLQTMTGILVNSINTGMVFVANKLGKEKFQDYVNAYGFGVKTGIELDTESSGTIDSLYLNKSNKVDCYISTASFGQGLTATPLQLVNAFAVIANGGKLMRPYIVDKIVYSDGKEEITKPREIKTILDKRNASLLSGMLVRVIDDGEGSLAKVPGYYVAGKTGTAQIAGKGGYTSDVNHTFIGFGPVDDPKFVILVKFGKPRLKFASTTAARTFSKITQFMMQYYHIPPSR